MQVVIVYESMYGNTHLVAGAIEAGFAPGADVTVVPVSAGGAGGGDGAAPLAGWGGGGGSEARQRTDTRARCAQSGTARVVRHAGAVPHQGGSFRYPYQGSGRADRTGIKGHRPGTPPA